MLAEFKGWLQGIDGGEKSPAAALAIMRDVNKYLKFIHPTSLKLPLLLDRKGILNYVETLKNFEIGVDGRTTKLDNIVYGIRFARHYYEDRDPFQVSYQQASSLLDDIRM